MLFKQIELYFIEMPLVSPFTTSHVRINTRNLTIIKVVDENGTIGWGECLAFDSPWYTSETQITCRAMLSHVFIPFLLQQNISHPSEFFNIFKWCKGNQMAKAGLESAIWDIYAKRNHRPLATAFGGKKPLIPSGISIGIQPSIDHLLEKMTIAQTEGYQRIKIKINPQFTTHTFEIIRKKFPDIPIIVDANGSLTLADLDFLKSLNQFNLLMIEQPLCENDLLDYQTLQATLDIPICLDESIQTFEDAKLAIELGACRVINIKQSRVGGITEAIRIHDYCLEKNIPVWCGGMLESGIGRAINIALSSLENFTIAGDISNTKRYFEHDITTPEVEVINGYITVPNSFGLGFIVDEEMLNHYTIHKEAFTKSAPL